MFNPLSTKDSAIQIALLLKGEDLWNLYYINKQLLGWICNNEQFWNQKIIQDFKINTYETLGRSGSLNDYRFLYDIKDVNSNVLNRLFIDESKTENIDHIRLLLAYGADVRADNDTALRWAAKNGHKDMVGLLLNYGANIHALIDGALIFASGNGHGDVVELLLNNGADLHEQNDLALRWAAKHGYRDVVELLINYGADIHAYNDDALKSAAKNGHRDVVEFIYQII